MSNDKDYMKEAEELIKQRLYDGCTGSLISVCGPVIAKLLEERDRLRTRIDELETVLSAWHEVFGTTQLTHAIDRLERAERRIDEIEKENEVLKGNVVYHREEVAGVLKEYEKLKSRCSVERLASVINYHPVPMTVESIMKLATRLNEAITGE